MLLLKETILIQHTHCGKETRLNGIAHNLVRIDDGEKLLPRSKHLCSI